MKRVAIFCPFVAADKYPFSDPYRRDSYQDLLLMFKEQGAEAYFAADNASYRGDGVFAQACTTDRKGQVADFRVAHEVRVGLVFDKGAWQGHGGFTGEDVMVINPPEVKRVAASKAETLKVFGEFQPRSVLCATRAELEAALEVLPGELVVVKEPAGNGGKMVYIGTRAKVKAELPDRYPLIAQEFVDTSVGIKGLVEGIHDFRVRIAGGTIVGGQVRTPAPGEYRANLAQGGTNRLLPADQVPAAVRALAQKIDSHFAQFPRYYSIDFAHTTQGWKLIELNREPGLAPLADGPEARKTMEHLVAYLLEVCPEI
jgi:glutathione synthase/RimK-type ligase-like ATP-grasp enzyme